MCRRIDNWHSDICWVAFWPEWPYWPLQWNRFVESMNKLRCPCLPTPCPNGKLKHWSWPVLVVIQYLHSKNIYRTKNIYRAELTVSSHESSARSWLSMLVVSMPGAEVFLLSTISEHITYSFCFWWWRLWYRLHSSEHASHTEKFCNIAIGACFIVSP